MRISTQLVVFLVLLNSVAGAVTASGLGGAWGINPSVGGDDQIDSVQNESQSIKGGGGIGDTLFQLYGSATRVFESIYGLAFYGPLMLQNLGIPGFITSIFSGVVSLLVAADLVYILTGRDI